jgi:hypothetical protein
VRIWPGGWPLAAGGWRLAAYGYSITHQSVSHMRLSRQAVVVAAPAIFLVQSGVRALIGQSKTAGVAQHVRMNGHRALGLLAVPMLHRVVRRALQGPTLLSEEKVWQICSFPRQSLRFRSAREIVAKLGMLCGSVHHVGRTLHYLEKPCTAIYLKHPLRLVSA